MIVPDPPEGELIRGPRCGTCGWPIQKVTFAGHFGEFTAPLCTNRNCPNSQLKPVRP